MGLKKLAFLLLAFCSCSRAQTVEVFATPTPNPTPTALVSLPPPPVLTAAGHALVVEFEVGGRSGYSPRPEAPDARFSGITWGIGYDAHQNARSIILADWSMLGPLPAKRLSDTQPYYGVSAQRHLRDVADIIVQWGPAIQVFDNVDVAREFANAKRAMPGFADIRANAQAAIISCGFNRGWSFIGPNRTEWRDIRDSGVPRQDYGRIAAQLRKMIRVWHGTSIERGMTRRRLAEAVLVETP